MDGVRVIPTLLVDAAATARLTRLITSDRLTRTFRAAWIAEAYTPGETVHGYPSPGEVAAKVLGHRPQWPARVSDDARWEEIAEHDPDPPLAAVFISCPWCVGMWVAAGVVAARAVAPRWWDPLARALAMSHVAGMAAAAE